MARSDKTDAQESDLATWLLTAIESHLPDERIRSTLVSRFGLREDAARIVQGQARDGILGAITGSRNNMPDAKADPIGHATFNLVWSTFNQNSFFDKRRTPSRKWLDWKEQALRQMPD